MSDRPLRVLVAEDDDLILMLLEDILDELGCSVASSVSVVTDAMDKVTSSTFDAAILDVRLRDGTIEPVADQLMAMGKPFALATGYAAKSLVERYGNVPVLQKPYLIDDVRRVLAGFARDRNDGAEMQSATT